MAESDELTLVLQYTVTLLKWTGFWRSRCKASSYNGLLYKAYTAYVLFALISHVYFEILYFIYEWKSITITQLASISFIMATGVTDTAMIISMFVNLEKIHFMLAQLDSVRFQPSNDVHFDILRKAKKRSTVFQKYFSINVACVICGLIARAFYTGEKVVLLAYIPSWFDDVYFLIWQIISIIYHGCVAVAYVCFNCCSMIQIGAQIDIVK